MVTRSAAGRRRTVSGLCRKRPRPRHSVAGAGNGNSRLLNTSFDRRSQSQIPDLVRGKRILVYDDVYTEGLTLREVARSLRDAGAIEVSEIVLAREPYGGQ